MKIIPTDNLTRLSDLPAPATEPGSTGYLTDANGDLVETDGEQEEDIANARRGELPASTDSSDSGSPAWLPALEADLQPLGKALASAMQAGDEAAVRGALKKLSARMPDFLNTPGLEAAIQEQFTAALAGTDSE